MILKTERLALRRLTLDDAENMALLVNDWDVAKVLARVPHPYSRDDAIWFINDVTAKDLPAWGIFTDRMIGVVGTEDHLGYWLGKSYWGKGYATEAATAALDYHFSDGKNAKIVSGHLPGNTASRHVLEKLGFVETGLSKTYSTALQEDVDHIDMLLTRAAWEAKRS